MATSKKQPPPTTEPIPTTTTPTPVTTTTAQQTDDVIIDTPTTIVTIDNGTVDAATAGAQPLPTKSIKDAFTGAATTMGNNLEGGSPGLPKDTGVFTVAFAVVTQVLSLFTGFHTFMLAVKRPQNAVLVPAAAAAVTQYWALLERLVPAALADINITNIIALAARLAFVQTLLKSVGTLNSRLLAVQSHLEDQLATQFRLLYDRCGALFLSHDDLIDPMDPVMQLFSSGGQKSAAARQNNQKVGDAAVAAAAAAATPAAPETPPASGIVVPPGTVVAPGTVVQPATVAQPVKAPAAQPPARKKGRLQRG